MTNSRVEIAHRHGWASGHQAGAQFAKISQSISPWRVGACEHTDNGRRPRHAARTLSGVAVAATTVASNKRTHRGRVMAEGAALARKQRAGGQIKIKKPRCVTKPMSPVESLSCLNLSISCEKAFLHNTARRDFTQTPKIAWRTAHTHTRCPPSVTALTLKPGHSRWGWSRP